ncbi:MAG: hypothetical protein ABDH21_05265 [bacterium]
MISKIIQNNIKHTNNDGVNKRVNDSNGKNNKEDIQTLKIKSDQVQILNQDDSNIKNKQIITEQDILSFGFLGFTISTAALPFVAGVLTGFCSLILGLILGSGLFNTLPAHIIQKLHLIYGIYLGLLAVGTPFAGFKAGQEAAKLIFSDKTEENYKKGIEYLKKLKPLEFEFAWDSINFGTKLGDIIGRNVSSSVSLPTSIATSIIAGAPIAYAVSKLIPGNLALATTAGVLASLPVVIKAYNATKEVSKDAHALHNSIISAGLLSIVGIIGEIALAIVKLIDVLLNPSKLWNQNKDQSDKNQTEGEYSVIEAVNKISKNSFNLLKSFSKGVAEVFSVATPITNLILGKITPVNVALSTYSGIVKLLKGLKDNSPTKLIDILSGASLIISPITGLFGPIGIALSAIITLLLEVLKDLYNLQQKVNQKVKLGKGYN